MQTAEETVSPTPERLAKGHARQVPGTEAGQHATMVVDRSDLIAFFDRCRMLAQEAMAFQLMPQQVESARNLQEMYERTGRSIAHAQRYSRTDGGTEHKMTDSEAEAFRQYQAAMRRIPANARTVVVDVVIMNQARDKDMPRLRAGLDALAR